MNTKEKSIELVNKFLNLKPKKMSDYSKIYLPTAKECVLICIENEYKSLRNFNLMLYDSSLIAKVDFINIGKSLDVIEQEVKKEIEKL